MRACQIHTNNLNRSHGRVVAGPNTCQLSDFRAWHHGISLDSNQLNSTWKGNFMER